MVLGTSALAWTYAAEIYGGLITSDTPSTIVGGGGDGAAGYEGTYEGEYAPGYQGGYKPDRLEERYEPGYRGGYEGGYEADGYASHLRKKAKA